MEKTKIVATIGPASVKPKVLKGMVLSGMDVCRLNFSHGDYRWHRMAIERICRTEKQLKKKIGIMADIQGPRLRVGGKADIKINKGEKIFLTDLRSPHNHGFSKEIQLDWNGFYEHMKAGDLVYIEDGLIQLKTVARKRWGCVAEVLVPGKVGKHKGVNIPAISSHMGFLTNKDLKDSEFIMEENVDFIAASFVSDDRDVKNLKIICSALREKFNKRQGGKKKLPWIVSKIERSRAMKNIEKIVKESDAIMVARGDLAIEMPQEKIGIFQKDIVSLCQKLKRPVIIATQMMASMEKNSRPTRAEISDVTNAVIDGADAVMLSGESANGSFPVETVETMSKIILAAERSPYNDRKLKKYGKLARMFFPGGGSKNKFKKILAKNLDSAIELSALRQEGAKIVLSGKNPEEKRKGTLVWGVV